MTQLQNFRLARYRMTLTALSTITMPPYAGSTLRGGFGHAFKKMVCTQGLIDCRDCTLNAVCPYPYIFETAPFEGAQQLRSYGDVPRPFVIDPLDTRGEYRKGESFSFQLTLIGRAIDYLPYFLVSFRELGEMGIGKGRGRFQLAHVRTEDTRELNTVATPLSLNNGDNTVMRVAFLATKQKASESRQLEQLLRTGTSEADMSVTECYLKDKLCLECPRCTLFGATSTESGRADRANIKHRIEYSTAFSLLPFEDIESSTTFNAINDLNQTTGQALGSRYAVVPATVFPSIVSLRSATLTEVILTIKTLLASKSYGAESRIGGDVRNSVFGIVGGWEEVITPLELTLELYDQQDNLGGDIFKTVVEKYRPLAGNPDRVTIFSPDEVDAIVEVAANTPLNQSLLTTAYNDAKAYVEAQQKK